MVWRKYLSERIYENRRPFGLYNLRNTDSFISYDGNYDAYLAYRESTASDTVSNIPKKPVVNDYKLRKEQASLERKRKTRISKIEQEIEEKEALCSQLENDISTPEISAEYEKLLEYTEKLNTIRNELEELYSEWEELQINE